MGQNSVNCGSAIYIYDAGGMDDAEAPDLQIHTVAWRCDR